MELDKTDKHILNILQLNAKITNNALSQKINLSPAATLERVRKLEQYGIITNYYAQLNYTKVGLSTAIMLTVRLQRATVEHIKLFKTTIDKMACITAAYQVIGDFDFMLEVHISDMAYYQRMVLEKLYALSIVEAINTLPVAQIIKNKPIAIG